MKTIIRCHTLFDITNTGILNRKAPINLPSEKLKEWELGRNRQSNFDTIIQVLSLRTQPEEITKPVESTISVDDDKFGFLFSEETEQPCWSFDFAIYYKDAYTDGVTELGGLYNDCDGVPMIKIGTEWAKLPNFLDTSSELRNIYFEVINGEA